MAKFKVGPAKTQGGNDVVIFEISDNIYGKIRTVGASQDLRSLDFAVWQAYAWDLSGHTNSPSFVLVPNVEPMRVSFETRVTGYSPTCTSGTQGCSLYQEPKKKLYPALIAYGSGPGVSDQLFASKEEAQKYYGSTKVVRLLTEYPGVEI